jgi:hypothetical protein
MDGKPETKNEKVYCGRAICEEVKSIIRLAIIHHAASSSKESKPSRHRRVRTKKILAKDIQIMLEDNTKIFFWQETSRPPNMVDYDRPKQRSAN